MNTLVVSIPCVIKFEPKAYMLKNKMISKMFEMEIKNFTDAELHRVFKDCVSENRLFACAKELIDLGMLTMADIYFLPCFGSHEDMLDEELTGHRFHSPCCNAHLTSLYLCPNCGVRYDWVIALYHTQGGAGICRQTNHFYIDGVCAECGHKEVEGGRTPRAVDGGDSPA